MTFARQPVPGYGFRLLSWGAGLLMMALSSDGRAVPAHGLALYGPEDLKYGPGEVYDYANPGAPKGGTIRLFGGSAFTQINPFSLKGTSAPRVAELVFETLMDGSLDPDEPFSQYGLIIRSIDLAQDRLTMECALRTNAWFTQRLPVEDDGIHSFRYKRIPLTADDVVFTFNKIRDPEFHPFYRNYYSEVTAVEKLDDYTVRFRFQRYNQELPLIVGQMPIIPAAIYGVEGKNFGTDFNDFAVGSGPYLIDSYDPAAYITYVRNPDWWGKELAINRGRYNFDKIIFKIFLDPNNTKLAIKTPDAGQRLDAMTVSSSKDWALEFNGPFVRKGWIRKGAFKHQRVARMQCYAFNLRKPVFEDIRIRKAIAAVFDFPFMNENLFYNQYTRQVNFWDNNPDMMSRGPATGKVRDILLQLQQRYNDPDAGVLHVPHDAILRGPCNLDTNVHGEQMPLADRIAAVNRYLDELGWTFDSEAGCRTREGQQLKFEILLASPAWKRLVNPFIEGLARVGITCNYRTVQPAEFVKMIKAFEFDMIVNTFAGSESPGNELINEWHSSAAGTPGSRNICGLRNPAVDETIKQIVAARSREDLVNQVKALDRILCAHHLVIPQWYIDLDRCLYWNRIRGPAKYASKAYLETNVIHWWWYDAAKARELDDAMRDNRPMPEAPVPLDEEDTAL